MTTSTYHEVIGNKVNKINQILQDFLPRDRSSSHGFFLRSRDLEGQSLKEMPGEQVCQETDIDK